MTGPFPASTTWPTPATFPGVNPDPRSGVNPYSGSSAEPQSVFKPLSFNASGPITALGGTSPGAGQTAQEVAAATQTALAKLASVNPQLADQLAGQYAGNDAGGGGLLDGLKHIAGSIFSPALSWGGKALDYLGRTSHIIPQWFDPDDEGDWATDIKQALTGESKTNWNEVLQNRGVLENAGWARATLGFGLDIATDPLTYATFGAGAGVSTTEKAVGAAKTAATEYGARLLSLKAGVALDEATTFMGKAWTHAAGELDNIATLRKYMTGGAEEFLGSLGKASKSEIDGVLADAFDLGSQAYTKVFSRTWKTFLNKPGSYIELESKARVAGKDLKPLFEAIAQSGNFAKYSDGSWNAAKAVAGSMGGLRFRFAVPFTQFRYISPMVPGSWKLGLGFLGRFGAGLSGEKVVQQFGPEAERLFATYGWTGLHDLASKGNAVIDLGRSGGRQVMEGTEAQRALAKKIVGEGGAGRADYFRSAFFSASERMGQLTAHLSPGARVYRRGLGFYFYREGIKTADRVRANMLDDLVYAIKGDGSGAYTKEELLSRFGSLYGKKAVRSGSITGEDLRDARLYVDYFGHKDIPRDPEQLDAWFWSSRPDRVAAHNTEVNVEMTPGGAMNAAEDTVAEHQAVLDDMHRVLEAVDGDRRQVLDDIVATESFGKTTAERHGVDVGDSAMPLERVWSIHPDDVHYLGDVHHSVDKDMHVVLPQGATEQQVRESGLREATLQADAGVMGVGLDLTEGAGGSGVKARVRGVHNIVDVNIEDLENIEGQAELSEEMVDAGVATLPQIRKQYADAMEKQGQDLANHVLPFVDSGKILKNEYEEEVGAGIITDTLKRGPNPPDAIRLMKDGKPQKLIVLDPSKVYTVTETAPHMMPQGGYFRRTLSSPLKERLGGVATKDGAKFFGDPGQAELAFRRRTRDMTLPEAERWVRNEINSAPVEKYGGIRVADDEDVFNWDVLASHHDYVQALGDSYFAVATGRTTQRMLQLGRLVPSQFGGIARTSRTQFQMPAARLKQLARSEAALQNAYLKITQRQGVADERLAKSMLESHNRLALAMSYIEAGLTGEDVIPAEQLTSALDSVVRSAARLQEVVTEESTRLGKRSVELDGYEKVTNDVLTALNRDEWDDLEKHLDDRRMLPGKSAVKPEADSDAISREAELGNDQWDEETRQFDEAVRKSSVKNSGYKAQEVSTGVWKVVKDDSTRTLGGREITIPGSTRYMRIEDGKVVAYRDVEATGETITAAKVKRQGYGGQLILAHWADEGVKTFEDIKRVTAMQQFSDDGVALNKWASRQVLAQNRVYHPDVIRDMLDRGELFVGKEGSILTKGGMLRKGGTRVRGLDEIAAERAQLDDAARSLGDLRRGAEGAPSAEDEVRKALDASVAEEAGAAAQEAKSGILDKARMRRLVELASAQTELDAATRRLDSLLEGRMMGGSLEDNHFVAGTIPPLSETRVVEGQMTGRRQVEDFYLRQDAAWRDPSTIDDPALRAEVEARKAENEVESVPFEDTLAKELKRYGIEPGDDPSATLDAMDDVGGLKATIWSDAMTNHNQQVLLLNNRTHDVAEKVNKWAEARARALPVHRDPEGGIPMPKMVVHGSPVPFEKLTMELASPNSIAGAGLYHTEDLASGGFPITHGYAQVFTDSYHETEDDALRAAERLRASGNMAIVGKAATDDYRAERFLRQTGNEAPPEVWEVTVARTTGGRVYSQTGLEKSAVDQELAKFKERGLYDESNYIISVEKQGNKQKDVQLPDESWTEESVPLYSVRVYSRQAPNLRPAYLDIRNPYDWDVVFTPEKEEELKQAYIRWVQNGDGMPEDLEYGMPVTVAKDGEDIDGYITFAELDDDGVMQYQVTSASNRDEVLYEGPNDDMSVMFDLPEEVNPERNWELARRGLYDPEDRWGEHLGYMSESDELTGEEMLEGAEPLEPASGYELQNTLSALTGDMESARKVIESAGYDGVTHTGGMGGAWNSDIMEAGKQTTEGRTHQVWIAFRDDQVHVAAKRPPIEAVTEQTRHVDELQSKVDDLKRQVPEAEAEQAVLEPQSIINTPEKLERELGVKHEANAPVDEEAPVQEWRTWQNENVEGIPKVLEDRLYGGALERIMDIGREVALKGRGDAAELGYAREMLDKARDYLDQIAQRLSQNAMKGGDEFISEDIEWFQALKNGFKNYDGPKNETLQSVQDVVTFVTEGKINRAQDELNHLEGLIFDNVKLSNAERLEKFRGQAAARMAAKGQAPVERGLSRAEQRAANRFGSAVTRTQRAGQATITRSEKEAFKRGGIVERAQQKVALAAAEFNRAQAEVAGAWAEMKPAAVFDIPPEGGFEGLRQVQIPGMGGVYVHPYMAEEMEYLFRGTTPSFLQRQWRHYVLGPWKRWATYRNPGFHIRNNFGAWFNNALGGVDNKDYEFAHRVLMARDNFKGYATKVVEPEDWKRLNFDSVANMDQLKGQMTYGDVSTMLADMGMGRASTTSVALTMGGEGLGTYGKAKAGVVMDQMHRLDHAGRRAGALTEDFHRTAAWMAGMRTTKGDLYGARGFVMVRHGDYAELTETENWVKDLIPFYKWMRTNVPYQFRQLAENPGTLLAVSDKSQTFAYAVQGKDRYEEEKNHPEWMNRGYNIPVNIGAVDSVTLDLPYTDLYNGARDYLSAGLPVIRNVIESYGIQQSIFTGAPLGNKMVPLSGIFANPVLSPVVEALPWAQKGADGQVYIPDTIDNVLSAVPIYSRFHNWAVSDPNRVENRTSSITSALLGLSLTHEDLTSAEQAFYYDELLPAIDRLKSMGYEFPTADQLHQAGSLVASYGAQPSADEAFPDGVAGALQPVNVLEGATQ